MYKLQNIDKDFLYYVTNEILLNKIDTNHAMNYCYQIILFFKTSKIIKF